MAKKGIGKALLSKSTFIRGMQCEKSLYLHKNRPFLRDPVPGWQLAKFNRGTKVGKIARMIYPGGLDASPKTHFQMAAAAKQTAEWIEQGVEVIYEAVFMYEQVSIALDILVKTPEGYKAVEVKSSLAISDTYIWDAALQYFVIAGNGISLADFSLVYVNQDYVHENEWSFDKLFIHKSVLGEAMDRLPEVQRKVAKFKEVVQLTGSPQIEIGQHCMSPYPCDFIGHCWKSIKKYSVFDLYGIDLARREEFYKQGYLHAVDVPVEKLESLHTRMHQQSIAQKRYLTDPQQLSDFLKLIRGKAALITCFSIQPPLPIFNGTSPYADIPVVVGLQAISVSPEEAEWFVMNWSSEEFLVGSLSESLKLFDTLIGFDCKEVLENVFSFLKLHDREFPKTFESSSFVDLYDPFSGKGIYWPQMSHSKTMDDILKDFHIPPAGNSDAVDFKRKDILLEMISDRKPLQNNSEIIQHVIAGEKARLANLKQMVGLLKSLAAEF